MGIISDIWKRLFGKKEKEVKYTGYQAPVQRERKTSPKGGINRLKIIGLAILIVVVVSLAGGMSGYMVQTTGLMVQVGDLESQLENSKVQVTKLTGDVNLCNNNLGQTEARVLACENDLANRNSDLSGCEIEKADVQQNLDLCVQEKASTSDDLASANEDYKDIVKNSVRAKCCSVSDIIDGVTRKWSLSDNNIVCSDAGDYSVDCSSGETDY